MGEQDTTIEQPFLVKIMRWLVYVTLLTPLVVSSRFFFPYVGPKGLFFMAVAEVIFFLWAYLAINYEQYRPTWNSVLITSTLFLIVLGVSAVFGADPSRSFWSKFERMSGVLFHLHLLAYLFAISSTFKFKKDWNNIFAGSLIVGMIVSVVFFLSQAGVDMGVWAAKNGSTLGNSSFLGTCLLFNVYLALILFVRSNKQFLKGIAIAGFVIPAVALLMSSADAARLSFLGGLVLLGLLYFTFGRSEKKVKIGGAVALVVLGVGFVMAVFHSQSPLHQRLVKGLGEPRFVVWRMAWEGFKARPLLGWGSNNFIMVYSRFFDPWKQVAGGAPWFDRAHNIVFNYLATTGILGLLSYVSLYLAVFYILAKRYLKRNKFWVPAIVTTLLIAYFVHLLTVFDMPASYMMFFLLLGFVASYKGRPAKEIKFKPKKYGAGVIILLVTLASLYTFVIKPIKAGTGTISAIQTIPGKEVINKVKKNNPNQVSQFLKRNSNDRLEVYKNTLDASPMGKYQIRNFFAQHSRNLIRRNIRTFPPQVAKKELKFAIDKLKKSRKQSPYDLKSLMNLIQAYAVYTSYNPDKLSKVEKYANQALEIAPQHQYGYWVLAQVNVQRKKFNKAIEYARKAVELEPRVPKSQLLLVQILQQAGKTKQAREQAKKAVELTPSLEKKLKPLLSTSSVQIKSKPANE